MEISRFSTRHNVMNIYTIQSFAGIFGGFHRECKDVYFVRCIGYNDTYTADIENMDRMLTEREQQGKGKYMRIADLPMLTDPAEIARYSELYMKWAMDHEQGLEFAFLSGNRELTQAVHNGFTKILSNFKQQSASVSESMRKNFMMKIFYWTAYIMEKFAPVWNSHVSCKLVYTKMPKKQEYLFLYFLTLLGIDVLILSPGGEIQVPEEWLALSAVIRLEHQGNVPIPLYRTQSRQASVQNIPVQQPQGRQVHIENTQAPRTNRAQPDSGRPELSFEELAQMASSVVMIAAHDDKGEVFATGSGIMISRDGYILTNSHVIRGGRFFSVRIEDDEQVYDTSEIIKYHNVLDLALIRINRPCNPIPIYNGSHSLVRGQKVVAIGSPLGLFNSVSDGIISGFRKLDGVDMIQFTAPISHGSSGGAVLNLSGEIIGISTAGIDSGQNINLAVNYTYIRDFVAGVLG